MKVIIVGTGPAGLTAMRIAMEYNHNILLIDQGPHFEPDYSARNLSLKGFNQITGGIGGTCSIWAGQLIPLSERELSSGDYAHLFEADEYRKQVFEILKWFRIGKIQYSFISLFSRIASKFENPRFSLVTPFLNLESIFSPELAKYALEPVRQKVKSLVFDGSRVTGLKLVSGRDIEVCSNDVLILAAGTMGNTKIILESFSGFSNSILGGNLADHPCGYVGTIFPRFKFGFFKKEVLYSTLGNGIKLKYELITEDTSGCFEIHPNKSNIRMRNLAAAYRELGFLEFLAQFLIRLINIFCNKVTLIPFNIADSAQIWIQFEQVNNQNSRIDLQSGNFSYGWHLNSQDMENFNTLIELIIEQLESRRRRFEIQKITSEEELNRWAQQANHPSGTLTRKLFEESPDIAIDQKQLLITGGALFPRASWVNPTLTIMAATAIGVRRLLKSDN